jgi:peptidoglycan-associated lipoprotein
MAAARPPSPAEFHPAVALQDVHFDFDRHSLRAGDTTLLEQDAAWLVSNPRTLVLVEGHTDERGTNEYNIVLGDRRATATRDYLIAHGVRPDRISLISYGEERPLCTEHAEACWARNRRSHFLVKPE